MWAWITLAALAVALNSVAGAGAGAARLICYVDNASTDSFSECTHLVYAGKARGDKLDALLKGYKKNNPGIKIVLRVSEADKNLRALLKSKNIQGLEVHDAHRALNKTKVQTFVEEARSALSTLGSGPLFLSLPGHPELLAKYYDLRALVKVVDQMMLETDTLGMMKKMTYHPSRLSGLWDMMNTDSVVDLVIGLGVPASKIVISLPATASQFTLVNETLSTPGAPAEDDQPKEIDQAELCRQLQKGRWTLERDQDLSAPYAFQNKTWISFEDASSVDVKGKYARIRGLAGLALKKADRDAETPCGPTLKAALAKVLNQQSRAPRALVLRSLENEILSAPSQVRALDALQVSPYRITQVVDSDGVIHSIREDTRTEFSCSRQGYFVHPRSCARFYRCVKFDQLSPDFTVFEFDCPAGLAFDGRYEVCVWPGSLPHSQACPGSSEIAPVPAARFQCPSHEGYYADPENCRWFFACLDHGRSPLTAYEFRCPFGLGFDADRLKCDWPWLVPACGDIGRYEAAAHGFSAAVLTGAAGFHGQTADAVNVAAHQSLISGATLDNLVGLQGNYLSQADGLDANFIASQEYQGSSLGQAINHGLAYQGNGGFVQPSQYSDEGKYTSGSLILDEFRQPGHSGHAKQAGGSQYSNGYNTGSIPSGLKSVQYNANSGSYKDESGAYIHDPTGDHAEPYRHEDAQAVPYIHDGSAYRKSNDYNYDGQYKHQSDYDGKYVDSNNGQYNQDNSGTYYGNNNNVYKSGYASSASGAYSADYSGSYGADYSGAYAGDSAGKYVAGVYRNDGQGSLYALNGADGKGISSVNIQQNQGNYAGANSAAYLIGSKAYTGASHTLAAGSVNVGLVGKTTLVDTGYSDQEKYQNVAAQNAYKSASSQVYNSGHIIVQQASQNGQLNYVSQPAVAINHLGTDAHNFDGYIYPTTPTASVVPTTVTPVAVTTAIPAVTTTYKTVLIPEVPKTDVKQVFGYAQPAVTFVQPTVIPVKQYATPQVEVTGYNQAVDYQSYENKASEVAAVAKSESSGYDYLKPSIQFEDGSSYTTAAPAVQSTYQPQAFSHQTIHQNSVNFGYSTPAPALAVEEPFKKLVAYTTTYNQPTASTFGAQSYNHQTVHEVNGAKVEGYEYGKPAVAFEEPKSYVVHSTAQPALAAPVVTNYQPQIVSHQTIHQENTGKVESVGYEYQNPVVAYEEPETYIEHTTAQPDIAIQPVVSYNQPQIFSHQTVHQVNTGETQKESIGYEYRKPGIAFEASKSHIEPAVTVQPVVNYQPQSFSHQTVHQVNTGSIDSVGYKYKKPELVVEQPKAYIEFSTPQPTVNVQPIVANYQPHIITQQTLHNVDASKVNIQSQESSYGYDYPKPAVKFVEAPKQIFEVSTAQPAFAVSTFRPQSYSQKVIHQSHSFVPVTSTPLPQIQYQQPSVTVYENPILKYTENITPVTYVKPTAAVFTKQSYQPVIQQHDVQHISKPVQYETVQNYNTQNVQFNQGYTYNQPEIQRDVETYKSENAYSLASEVSHQVFHQSQGQKQYNENKDVVFVSTTPSRLAYEEHYSEYEAPKKIETYQSTEYIPPRTIHTVSTVSPPVVQKVATYQAPEYIPPKTEYQTTFSVTSPSVVQKEITYKAPEYVPPKTIYEESYVASPVVTSAADQQQYSYVQHAQNQYNYQQDYSQQYDRSQKIVPIQQVSFSTSHIEQPEKVESYHISSFPSASVTDKPVTYQVPEIQDGYKAEEYLPPVVSTVTPVVTSTYKPRTYSSTTFTPRTYSSSTSKEYLHPFQESDNVEYLPPKADNSYLPPSTTARPIYKSTTYKAPEYLPPQDESNYKESNFESFGLKNNPYDGYSVKLEQALTRKQNKAVQTAKSNLLGFGTVGPDAGLISPGYISSTESYSTPYIVTSTYAPIEQALVKATLAPVRRTKPKVAVVTKINDFNPLLVRKLGAVCSCQSPIVVLKGRRPNVQIQTEYDVDYGNDYEDSGRGDIEAHDFVRTSEKVKIPAKIKSVTVAPATSTTFNPIIVPDDSYYEDISGPSEYNVAITPKNKEVYSESYVSSTPVVVSSTTQKIYTIRPRVKAVTVAPTYKTVLLKESAPTQAIIVEDGEGSHAHSVVESQTFDRYGPGGLRGRDETLQGSVDCQRAGLFRHPKHCNKFYACRWDCTKQRFTLHVFNCPVQLSFDPSIGACNWPSQGPACQGDTLLTNSL